jgi:aminopeptidase
MTDVERLMEKLAELTAWGTNVQPGQIVAITSAIGKEELTRRVARAAYERGAKYVDVLYWDVWIKRERVEVAPEDTLEYVPPWLRERLFWLSDEHAARITLSGPQAPRALRDLDATRVGKDMLPRQQESPEVVNRMTTNWCLVPGPNPAWAEAVYPDLAPDEAYRALWDSISYICRLDADDPAEAWTTRSDELKANAQRLTDRRFDAVRLHGPGTDLTIGLLPSAHWAGGDLETVDGVRHSPNIPTEEIFTTPDPARVDGFVSATMPLELSGSIIEGIRVEFEGGRAVKLDADRGAETLRSVVAKDDGASRLGEVALVDAMGRVGPLETVFLDTLIDENAASHLALGNGYFHPVEDEDDLARVNRSGVHVDFMIGSPELHVDGITRDGDAVPVLRAGVWQV